MQPQFGTIPRLITVTRSFLPPPELYQEYVSEIWHSGQLTNMGALVRRLRSQLIDHLGTADLVLTNNGTSPLQIAVQHFAQGAEVITTPFSYIATSAAIAWQGCTPVFVDIDPDHLTIDENLIEAAITPRTRAILATHVFGNPCNIEALAAIGRKHQLPIIYDAAHCFGVTWRGESIFNYGDVSTCSFHATKIFHTAEGGALFARDKRLLQTLRSRANSGHRGYYDFEGLGINAKMSELHAAMGLSVLPHIPAILQHRANVYQTYRENLNFRHVREMKIRSETEWNHSYVPILLPDSESVVRCISRLNDEGIQPRRYFYPSLNSLPFLPDGTVPVAEEVAKRVLCLPTYFGLDTADVCRISALVNLAASPAVTVAT